MKYLSAFSFCTLMFCSLYSLGQASLAAENIIDDIKVTTKYGKQKVYTVCRDARVTDQWYYMPNELRVAEEVSVGGKTRPKMTILRYQYKDPLTNDNKEGGVLVASFTYAIEPEVIDQVKQQIKQRKGLASITLSAIPLNSSSIDFLSASDQFIGNVDAKSVSGLSGATSASQEMVISYNLTPLGASVFKALAGSGGGIPIRGNITYNGLSAPCGYSIKGKWDNVYKYFEQNRLIDGRFKFWFISGGGSTSKNEVKESLSTIQDMQVQVVECPSAGSDSGQNTDDANMKELIKTIQTEVLSDSMMNRVSELAKLQAMYLTADPTTAEKIEKMIATERAMIQVGYQNSTKNISKRRKGAITYDFSRQKMIIRPSSIGGLLSFSKYGLDEAKLKQEGYIVDIDANQDFPSVIIGLPNISPDFDLRTITLDVSYKNSKGTTHSEARQWNASTNGWVTPTNAAQGYVRFNLIGETDSKMAAEPEFDVKLQVISKIPNGSFTIQKKIKLSTGERYIDAIELLTKQFIVDGSALDFSKTTNNPADLAFAKLIFNKGAVTVNKDIKPFIKDGIAGPPTPVYLLLPNDGSSESGKITYTTGSGQKIDRAEPLAVGENTLGNFEWKTAQN
ncbi:MAG: hypothetical protein ABI687_06050 [Flavitalea sp.]